MSLHPDERYAVVTYRLSKASQTLEEAEAVSKMSFWSLTANRLYYAAYYACVALLIHNQLEANTHNGVIRMIGLHFVKHGILESADSRLLGRLFNMRQTGDYDDFFDWTEHDVLPLIPEVRQFIDKVKRLIGQDT